MKRTPKVGQPTREVFNIGKLTYEDKKEIVKLYNEMFYGHEYEFETLEQFQEAMDEYISYYNEKRITVK